MTSLLVTAASALALALPAPPGEGRPRHPEGPSAVAGPVSGIYPRLAMFNDEDECGTGAVVPWADRLWVVTYAPHKPNGSTDKLYEIDRDLKRATRPESVGGTPANRLVHRESGQLFIGPYAIDRQGRVRVISPRVMPGRLTATTRHLFDPAHKVYFATMEEGFYEVDTASLAVRTLYPDANGDRSGDLAGTLLPGYHGKGAYTGQGRLVYANNGERSPEALKRPEVPSGCLAEWDGKTWKVVRRNQFTEVTGPGGIEGNADSDHDPLWSIGWDHRSLLLMLRDGGVWHAFRLPRPGHSYDGAHGWNTEWPRIRDVGGPDLLMTMHGAFWHFPRGFRAGSTAGIRPRSTYLKVVGDFARWQDRIVLGCDDTARSGFLNERKAQGGLAGPGQSQSNLWFLEPAQLDALGPTAGHGAVWLDEPVAADTWSDPYLFAGSERRGIHIWHGERTAVTLTFELDVNGQDHWQPFRTVVAPPGPETWLEVPRDQPGEWVRVRADRACDRLTVLFDGSNADDRPPSPAPLFDPLAGPADRAFSGGLMRCRGEGRKTLQLAAQRVEGTRVEDVGYYELDGDLRLRRVEDPEAHAWLKSHAAVPRGVLEIDAASVVYRDDVGRRWRLPRGDESLVGPTRDGLLRVDREVVTERDLFQAVGTIYELPAENAGGFAKLRPICSHDRRTVDFASYRGLLVLTGLRDGATGPRVVRSDDGKAAVWVGAVDDLWKLGKPVGEGGPWLGTPVHAGVPSDPYLMAGYDQRELRLEHEGAGTLSVRVEVDPTGDGRWVAYQTFDVPAGVPVVHRFPAAYHARWVRAVAERDGVATAQLTYR